MKPIDFKEKTKVLTKPKSMTDAECQPLAVWNADGKKCISCWKASFLERLKILFTGKVWVWVYSGKLSPPVLIEAKYPFTKEKK